MCSGWNRTNLELVPPVEKGEQMGTVRKGFAEELAEQMGDDRVAIKRSSYLPRWTVCSFGESNITETHSSGRFGM